LQDRLTFVHPFHVARRTPVRPRQTRLVRSVRLPASSGGTEL